MSKLEKTLQRFQQKLAQNDHYEAHQTLRTIVNRHVRAKTYEDAIELLYKGAGLLFHEGEQSMGSDLTSYLIQVFEESATPVANDSKDKLITLLNLFDPQEPSLKQVATEAINWSVKHGSQPWGDADLHHVIGVKLMDAHPYDSERHFILGCSSSMEQYIAHIWEWYLSDDAKNIDRYIMRIVLNYLFVQNIKAANHSLNELLSKFIDVKQYPYEQVSESEYQIKMFDIPLLNFIQLLLKTVIKGDSKLYRSLIGHYDNDLKEYKDALDYLGELYFGLKVQKPVNMMDLVSGLFK
jgi:hypothetical protein